MPVEAVTLLVVPEDEHLLLLHGIPARPGLEGTHEDQQVQLRKAAEVPGGLP